VSKTPANSATPKKPAPKPAATKPVVKAATKPSPATKPASKTDTKPAPKAHPANHHPATAAAPTASVPAVKASHPNPATAVKTPPPVPAKAPAPAAAPKPVSSRSTSRSHAAAPAAAPLPLPTSRFADRFAPPRPPTRQMNSLSVDIQKTTHKSDPKLANAWKSKAGKDLTEAELLAMPDSEYMNDKQLEFFRARLQTLKDDLLSNAGETTEHLREDTSIVPDPADRATIEEEHALELRTRDRERKLLKKISQSLARIDAGDYGFCDETGEPIGLGRLIARPTATLSLEAQQRRELKQKMFGD
jgi:DnaK suppressor protein